MGGGVGAAPPRTPASKMAPKKEPPAPRPRRTRALTEAERLLWQQITQQSTPLRPTLAPTPAPPVQPDAPLPRLAGPVLAPFNPAEPVPLKRAKPPTIKVGKLDNIDRATALKTKKGTDQQIQQRFKHKTKISQYINVRTSSMLV